MDDQAIEQEIVAKGLTAPRITPADIDANIASEHYFVGGDGIYGAAHKAGDHAIQQFPQSLDLLTFCVLVLRNGFTVTGESACASPENFSAEIGQKIARQNAVQKIWPLMGYELKQRLASGPAKQQPAPGAAHAGYSTMPPHQQRVVDEKAELDDKTTKLSAFFSNPIFEKLDAAEQERLRTQAIAMKTYSDILGERIAAF